MSVLLIPKKSWGMRLTGYQPLWPSVIVFREGMGSNVVIGGNKSFSLKLLCALLNSKVGSWWFATNGKKRGAGVDVGVDRLRHFPLPNASSRFAEVEKLVDRIIAAKAKQPNTDTSGAEQNINELVYALYGLTSDEIALIEAAH